MKLESNPRLAMIDGMVARLTGPARVEIIVQAELCDGCGDCVDACRNAVVNDHPGEPTARIRIVSEGGAHFPILCRNCEDSPCAAACMTGSRRRREQGFVTTDYSRCMGCGMCIMVCPFGAIEPVGAEHKAYKCEGCTETDVPACIQSCRRSALVKGDALLYSFSRRKHTAASIAFSAGKGNQDRP